MAINPEIANINVGCGAADEGQSFAFGIVERGDLDRHDPYMIVCYRFNQRYYVRVRQ
jgi:hypothetical protein